MAEPQMHGTKIKTRTKAVVATAVIAAGLIAAAYAGVTLQRPNTPKKPDLQLAGAVSRTNASFSCVLNNTCVVNDIYGSIQIVNVGGVAPSNLPVKVKFEVQKANGTVVPIRVWQSTMETSYNYNTVIKTPGFTQYPFGTPTEFTAITVGAALTGNSAQGPNTFVEIPAIIARAFLNETGQTPLDAKKLVVTVDAGNSIAESNEGNNVKVYQLPAPVVMQ